MPDLRGPDVAFDARCHPDRIGVLVLAIRLGADPFIWHELVEGDAPSVKGAAPTSARLVRSGQRFPDTQDLFRFEEQSAEAAWLGLFDDDRDFCASGWLSGRGRFKSGYTGVNPDGNGENLPLRLHGRDRAFGSDGRI